MREIYNLGRVMGFSAYELYVRQNEYEDPGSIPASEREWLASTIAMGSSMLCRIEADMSHDPEDDWVLEVPFPENTRLGAANTIVGSFFRGEAEYYNGWAQRVTDYGELVCNTAENHPDAEVTDASNMPIQDVTNWPTELKEELAQYLKIVDGVVLQPGKWPDSENKPPEKDFLPNLGEVPVLRLHIKGRIERDFQVLLTGFTIRTVVRGVVGLDGCTASPAPEDGDFLGPGQYPWANKVVFTVPTSYVAYFVAGAYKRQLPSGAAERRVDDTVVVDMKTTQPETYYKSKNSDSRVPVNVTEFSTLGDGTCVFTIYQKSPNYPPVLWGTYVDSEGQNYLNPIDVAAPGTMKLFRNSGESELREYQNTYPGANGFSTHQADGTLNMLDNGSAEVPVARTDVEDFFYEKTGNGPETAKVINTTTGNLHHYSLSMEDDNNRLYTISLDQQNYKTVGNTRFDIGSQTKIVPNSSNVNWSQLLEALANNKSIDLLGDNLKAVKAGLPRNYVQFPNGLRLYISSTEPDDNDVPIGSIGIGWGFEVE